MRKCDASDRINTYFDANLIMEGCMEASHDVAVHSTVGATTYANIIRATAET